MNLDDLAADMRAETLELLKFVARRREERDVEVLAQVLVTLKEAIGSLSMVLTDTEAALAEVMPANVMAVPDVGVLERRSSKQRKGWDHTALASWLAARVADRPFNQETGEQLSTLELCDEVAREILECAGVGYWKVSALKLRDVDASKYCDEGDVRTTVTVRPVG